MVFPVRPCRWRRSAARAAVPTALVVVMTSLLGLGTAALACGPTLSLSSTSGWPGSLVQLQGAGFVPKAPVTLRWHGATSTAGALLLGHTTPDQAGRILATFRVPPGAVAGEDVIAVTQPAGALVPGTSGGALFEVLGTGTAARAHHRALNTAAGLLLAVALALLTGLAALSRRRLGGHRPARAELSAPADRQRTDEVQQQTPVEAGLAARERVGAPR